MVSKLIVPVFYYSEKVITFLLQSKRIIHLFEKIQKIRYTKITSEKISAAEQSAVNFWVIRLAFNKTEIILKNYWIFVILGMLFICLIS